MCIFVKMVIFKQKFINGISFMKNLNILITGGSRGIGAELVREFAMKNHNVAFSYSKSKNKASGLVKELSENSENKNKILAIKADISKKEQVESMVDEVIKKFGYIDILINNAGISQQKLFTDITQSDWDSMIATNLNSVFYTCQSVVPSMIKRRTGKILNISSVWGIVGASCEVHYSASKAAIIGFTKALAKELGPSNINVNCLAPGIIDTDMNSNLDQTEKANIIQQIPLNRFGDSKEIAKIAFFLCSESASYITGQVITADGGWVI